MRKDFKIIENTDKARDEFGWNYGGEIKEITPDQLDALRNGKMLATDINGEEYTLFIELKI